MRRYAGKLAYEIELHSGTALESLPDRYAEHLSAAVGVPYPRGDYLEDVDGGFYCTCYLRAWAFEAQLRDHLKSRFGSDWFRRRGGRRPAARALEPRASRSAPTTSCAS